MVGALSVWIQRETTGYRSKTLFSLNDPQNPERRQHQQQQQQKQQQQRCRYAYSTDYIVSSLSLLLMQQLTMVSRNVILTAILLHSFTHRLHSLAIHQVDRQWMRAALYLCTFRESADTEIQILFTICHTFFLLNLLLYQTIGYFDIFQHELKVCLIPRKHLQFHTSNLLLNSIKAVWQCAYTIQM